jgi:hypothetical protein
MLEVPREIYKPAHLLAEIEWTRYRAGKCTGSYLERIHYLNEWFLDNDARGNVKEITRTFGKDELLTGRENREMTVLWKSYRYLRENPDLRPKMTAIEAQVNRLPVHYIPNAKVAAIESKLQPGDIVGIVTKNQGGVCSHVGLIVRLQGDARARIMHASSNAKRVIIDASLSEYLRAYTAHMGAIIARPLPVANTIRDQAAYKANFRKLSGGILIAQ